MRLDLRRCVIAINRIDRRAILFLHLSPMTLSTTTAKSKLNFACVCGQVAGILLDVSPTEGSRVFCHCGDCQNFAYNLGAAERVLQRYGGTDLYQGRCAKMQITSGADKLACLHLTDAPTLRWYSACCRTPMFNSYANGRVPYVTTLLANCDPDEVEAVLGPAIGHLFLPDHLGDLPGFSRMSESKLMRHFFGRLVRDLISGDRRRSALFDAKTLAPISQPYRLTAAERARLAQLRKDAPSSF